MSDEKRTEREARTYDGIEEEVLVDEEADRTQSDLPGDPEDGAAADPELAGRLAEALAEKRRQRQAVRDRRSRRRDPPARSAGRQVPVPTTLKHRGRSRNGPPPGRRR